MVTIRILALTSILLAFNGQTAHDEAKLTIVTEHLPPYQIVDEKGGISGFATELIEILMSETKIPYQHDAYSWTRSYNLAKTRKNTCIYSIARIPSREMLFRWVGSLTETHAVIYAHSKNEDIKVNSITDAKNYVIAVIKDDVTHLALKERGFSEGKNLYVLDNTKSLISLLVNKDEIDLIVADDITLPYRAEIAKVDLNLIKRMIEIDGLSLNFFLACNPETDENIIETLSFHLKKLKASKRYQNVLKRWQYNIPLTKH
ncbi:substrate-binding periplasmic protein [Thalassotalea ganghwensis]